MYGLRVYGESGDLQIDGTHKAVHLVWSGTVRMRAWASDDAMDAGYYWYDLGAPEWISSIPEKIVVTRSANISVGVASLSWWRNALLPGSTYYSRLVIGQHATLDVIPGYGWVDEDVEVYVFAPQRINKGGHGFGLRVWGESGVEVYHSDDYPLRMVNPGLPIGMDHPVPVSAGRPAVLVNFAHQYQQTGDPQSGIGWVSDLLRFSGSTVVSTKFGGSSPSVGRGTFSIVDVGRLPFPYISPQF